MDTSSTALSVLQSNNPHAADNKSSERRLEVARNFEKMFVSEMLRLTELSNSTDGIFSGGFGEEAFRSFMIDAYSEKIVETGSFGISEVVFQALSQKEQP